MKKKNQQKRVTKFSQCWNSFNGTKQGNTGSYHDAECNTFESVSVSKRLGEDRAEDRWTTGRGVLSGVRAVR